MFTELATKHQNLIIELLKKDIYFNTFILGNIFRYGLKQQFQQTLGILQEDKLHAILFKFFHNYIFYFSKPTEKILHTFTKFIENTYCNLENKNSTFLCTKENLTYLQQYKKDLTKNLNVQENTFLKLNSKTKIEEVLKIEKQILENAYKFKISKPTIENITKILTLRKKIKEFKNIPTKEEIMFFMQNGRTFVLEKENIPVAMACTTFENPYTAMLIDIATDPLYRKKGLATFLVAKLCNNLINEGKKVCLFYDDPPEPLHETNL